MPLKCQHGEEYLDDEEYEVAEEPEASKSSYTVKVTVKKDR